MILGKLTGVTAAMLVALGVMTAFALASPGPGDAADPKVSIRYGADGRATWTAGDSAPNELGRIEAAVSPTVIALERLKESIATARVELRFERPTPATWVTPILEMCAERAVGIREVRIAPIEGTEAAPSTVPGVVLASVVDLAAIEEGKSGSRVRLGGFTWSLESQLEAAGEEEAARARKRRASVLKEIAAAAVRMAAATTSPELRLSATGSDCAVRCQDLIDVLAVLRPAGFARLEFVATTLPRTEAPAPVAAPTRAPERTAPSVDAGKWPPAVVAFLGDWAAPEGKSVDKVTGYPAKIRRTKDDMVMVLIPGGTFLMGAVPSEYEPSEFELPRHSVTLSKAYYMDEHEVMNAQFSKFAAAWPDALRDLDGWTWGIDESGDMALFKDTTSWLTPEQITWRKPQIGAGPPKDWGRHPVVLVTWAEADAYAAWVGPRRDLERPPTEGVGLPTEAQFERALRGGVDGELYWWGNSRKVPARAGNYGDETTNRRYGLKRQGRWGGDLFEGYDDGYLLTAPVKSFRPNRYGLYDLGGNVWEYCWDRRGREFGYLTGPKVLDPLGPDEGHDRILRGTSFIFCDWGHCYNGDSPRSSNRESARPNERLPHVGFRCARSLP